MVRKSRLAGVGRSGAEDKISGRSRAQVLYADSEKDGNMLYATRVFVPDPFLFFRWRGKKHIAVGDLELSRLRREANVDRVFSYRDFAGPGRKQVGGSRSIAEVCSEIFGQLRIRAIEVPHSFPAGLADELRARGFRVNPKPDPFFPEREVKDGKEVARIVQAIRAAEHGMEAAVRALRQARVNKRKPGLLVLGAERLTSERLRAIIHKAILEKDCHARNTIVSCAKQSFDPHQRGEGVLKAHEPIIVDIFPRCEVSGYYGDLTRTFVKGEASSRIRGMYEAVKRAQSLAIEKVHCGVDGRRIHTEVVRLLEKLGFPTREEGGQSVGFFHGTGHGLGLDLHEHPTVGAKPVRLRTGNVITVEPGLYYPDAGGVRLEDVVQVGPRKAKNLTRFPKFLEV